MHTPRIRFADLKNDFVFRRIFGNHPELLKALLNDLLARTEANWIEQIEYLPSEQAPLVEGAKFSILDLRCVDASGTRFIVEMQLLHVSGFLNRVVYNACKAIVSQLSSGQPYTELADVVAISICDFELWPNAEQDRRGEARLPMVSRFSLAEETTGKRDLRQVQYVFVELPKAPTERPGGGAALWAWLLRNGKNLSAMPDDLPAGLWQQVLVLANESTFSFEELNAYRRAADEIQQAVELANDKYRLGVAEGETRGRAAGRAEGEAKGRAEGAAKGRQALLRAAARLLPAHQVARLSEIASLDELQVELERALGSDA